MARLIFFVTLIVSIGCLMSFELAKNAALRIGNNDVNESNYKINKSVAYDDDGNCLIGVIVTGKSINDSFNDSCSNMDSDVLTLNYLLIYGNPQKNSLCLYSDAPSSLVVIREGKCVKKTYSITDSGTKSITKPLNQIECDSIKKKIQDRHEHTSENSTFYLRGLQQDEEVSSSSPYPNTSNFTFSLTWRNTITQMLRNIVSRLFKWVFGT